MGKISGCIGSLSLSGKGSQPPIKGCSTRENSRALCGGFGGRGALAVVAEHEVQLDATEGEGNLWRRAS